jgi:hypothetical protein
MELGIRSTSVAPSGARTSTGTSRSSSVIAKSRRVARSIMRPARIKERQRSVKASMLVEALGAQKGGGMSTARRAWSRLSPQSGIASTIAWTIPTVVPPIAACAWK